MESMGNYIAGIYKKAGKPLPHQLTEEISSEEEAQEKRRQYAMALEEEKCKFFNESNGALHEQDGYDCHHCKNKGGRMEVRVGISGYPEQVYIPCKCMKVRGMIAKLERSGLKNIIKDYSFEKFETTEEWQKTIKDVAIRFTQDDEHTWFFIGGNSGAGKTHLCTAITAHYLRKNKAARYMLWRDEIPRIKAIVNDSDKYNEAITELKTTEVLYIDDLFKMGKDKDGNVQPPTVADINIAFEILNYRYNNKELVTIISSERTITDILEIDEAIGGRISEMTVPHGYYIGIKKDPAKNYRTKGIIEI